MATRFDNWIFQRRKQQLEDLALFGGTPCFASPLHVGRPNIVNPSTILDRWSDVLRSGWLTNDGPELKRFERQLAERMEVRHCIATCNATIALQLAIRALDLSGEVIVPSFTFPATAHALAWQNVTPVFSDINPTDWTLDVEHVQQLITPRTTGIMGVHLFGTPCQVDALQQLAERHHLRLLFDACHALDCTYRGRPIGGMGDAEVFSFHATKFVNAGEGGAITTNDAELADRLRRLRNFGFDAEGHVEEAGTNGKMSEFSAAMGSCSLEQADRVIHHNFRNLECYQRLLAGIPGLHVRIPTRGELHNFQYVVTELDAARFGLTRDEVLNILRSENILARKYFYPGCHRLKPYALAQPHRLPVTESVLERVLVLPTGLAMDSPEIETICDLFRFLSHHARDIRLQLAGGTLDGPFDTSANHPAPSLIVRIESGDPLLPAAHAISTTAMLT